MSKSAGVINVFETPYEAWSERKAAPEESAELIKLGIPLLQALTVKDHLLERVSNHNEAAARMLRVLVDNGLEGHVEGALDSSANYHELRALMPSEVPGALDEYQGAYGGHDSALADAAINAHGVELADGQILFHGGKWGSSSSTFITTRPFSTSFCPQVALRNAEWKGKAYDAGRVDLMVVRVGSSTTKAYAYGREGQHGNEKEVVFASDAQLTLVAETYIADVKVSKMDVDLRQVDKVVPAYLLEVELR